MLFELSTIVTYERSTIVTYERSTIVTYELSTGTVPFHARQRPAFSSVEPLS